MDDCSQSKCRVLRLASHNKSSADQSNSSFSVVFGNEMQSVGAEWGGITGISFDSVGFPNVFPNVYAPWNEVLIRQTDPGNDTYATAGEDLVVIAEDFPNETRTIVVPAAANSTDLAAAITAASVDLYPELAPGLSWITAAISPIDGSILLFARGPTALVSGNWNSIIGVALQQTQHGYQTSWIAYPLDPTNFIALIIPPGFYDNIQLAQAVAAEIEAAIGPAVVISEITPGFDYRYQLTSTVPVQLVIRQFPTYVHVDPRQLLQQMGFFNPPQQISDGSGTVGNPLILADAMPVLFGEIVVYVHSTILSRDCRGFDGEGAIEHHVLTVPIDVPYLGYQNWSPNQYQNPTIKYANPMSLTTADLRLRNIYGDVLDIGANQQMYVVVRLWYEK